MREKIFWIFGLFNFALLVFAGFFWLAPTALSLQTGLSSLRNLEQRYAASSEIFRSSADVVFLNYEEILSALAETASRGAEFGLEILEFSTDEISNLSQISPNENLYEIRVAAEYDGNFDGTIDFLRDFQNTHGYIRSFTVLIEETTSLRLQFSIFGAR
ncbi:MAG: hypothetical protein FWF77_09705 [Defluviitaleaceae bacterium]|nr:hypothetical protein [Defluviitaleaceae bacterium]